ncbi:uncharacterized protein ASCRUDRAFT_13680 [Ascoidea rubescens DSM 1968]|uniref:Uncharacterized protein n=1 Tax=Ascoidea rubescens DSM 1968 TaxID=1344418 RepID=A0A1D2VG65_9ASCO|nr:hypothetical protein ASCRUDRAFT_13680 [Ascoidea rubescens DSM 1968]ODV60651.1 hypothetical protein ASCRUDRAFT_13680 [Ascoidea rubescens DSM 1968]
MIKLMVINQEKIHNFLFDVESHFRSSLMTSAEAIHRIDLNSSPLASTICLSSVIVGIRSSLSIEA